MTAAPLVVPPRLAGYLEKFYGEQGRAWATGLPGLAAAFLDRWELTPDGPARHGMVALVLPVRRSDGDPAALKLQPLDPEHPGEPSALRAWRGDGAVRLLDADPATGTMLLERLDGDRDLRGEPDDLKAVQIIAELLARLHACDPPDDIMPLRDVVAGMLAYAPRAAAALADPADTRLVNGWASAVTEVAGEPGDRLLHWDLHFENVLAAGREPWLAIDPKPLAGDPGFDLLPALHNRTDEILAAADPRRAVLRRFDLMVEILGLDRGRATAWTLARVLQNTLWSIENGVRTIDSIQALIADALTHRPAAR
ncbi:aminoglycoside phosphotransferase family protein [Micromonospora sp. NPDC049559]|uniref:aminoglycoside phosphotransferase family protein n=1 Tax=Micromonospora sp. NPDC049559 TaxID=3155923 RepID=UPI0034363C9D